MPGERHLAQLLSALQPLLQPETYVFCTLNHTPSAEQLDTLSPFATVQEPEGLSVVLTREIADKNSLQFDGCFHCIRLDVHSSLEAVGLTAAVSSALAEAGISANVIAGAFHDHILVPQKDADRALSILQTLSASSRV